MRNTNIHRPPAFALGLLLTLPAWAKVTRAEEGVYGGEDSADCNDIYALRVRLYGDVMPVERAGKAVIAKPFKSSKTAASGTAPPAFRIAHVGEVKGGDGLVFVMTHDASGLFVTLEGGAKSLATLSGPAPQVRTLQVAGIGMPLAARCKPHDCGENNTVMLYDAAAPSVYGIVYQSARTTRLGNPPPARAAELDKLWRQQWRAGK